MEERLIARRTSRVRRQEYKEFAAGTCYSVLMIIVALVLLRPLMINHILSRASAYSAMGQIEESRRQCDKALLIDSESSQAWYGLARFYRVVGEREMALGAYQKATQADNTNKPAQSELGRMYVEDGLYEMAILCFEQVRRLGPDRSRDLRQGVAYHRDALDTLALCYEKTGDLTKTELMLEELRIFYPGHGNADERLSRVKAGRTRQE